jgi:DNA-binding GntR family transcriptional regulator
MTEGMRVERATPIREQIAEHLRVAIADLRLRPGAVLIERELCESTGASRPSVREALRQLESEGLLVSAPGKGTKVATLSVEEARHVYQVRGVLEGLAGRLFATLASDEDRAQLHDAFGAVQDALTEPRQLLKAKDRFYAVLMRGAQNPIAEQTLNALYRRVTLLRATSLARSGRPTQSIQEIQAIVQAIDDRDPDATERACRKHVRSAEQVALEVSPEKEEA